MNMIYCIYLRRHLSGIFSLQNPSEIPHRLGWEKRGVFRNVKALILNDLGVWRRGENYKTTISSPVSRTKHV